MDFRQQSLPEEGGKLPQFFVDLESHDLGTPSDVAPQFEGDVYENGIKVVSGELVVSFQEQLVRVPICIATLNFEPEMDWLSKGLF